MLLIDHTDPHWQAVYQQHGRENGAATYSRELVKFQVPVWEQELPGAAVTVSTCPLLRDRRLPGGDLVVQYLHEWRFKQPQRAAVALHATLRASYPRVVFIVAYKGLQALLEGEGLDALYVPMSIDTEQVAPHRLPDHLRWPADRVAYFGNVQRPKAAHYRDLHKSFPRSRLTLTKVEGRQPEVWADLARYRLGAGVGRCALEMAALGLRVLVTGRSFGGIIVDEKDYLLQQETNFNGRIVTGTDNLDKALRLLPDTMLWNPLDSREAAEILRGEIRGRRLSVS